MHSTAFYNLSTAGYIFSLALFAFHVIKTRSLILKSGLLFLAVSFLIQTGGMVLRWIEAGFLEVASAEKAVGEVLTGWSWFVVFTQHPPWSNLYEIMVYMSWGVIMVTMFAEIKWRLAWVRQVGIVLALLALGMASLTDASIKPLVPALKSWWIMIHVISASIAYAAGSIAAFICLFAVFKDEKRVNKDIVIGLSLVMLGILLFFLSGGIRFFTEQAFFVKLLAYAGENIVNVMDMAQEKPKSFLVPMPGAFLAIFSTLLLHIILGFFILFRYYFKKTTPLLPIFIVCFISSLGSLLLMVFHGIRNTNIEVGQTVFHHLTPAGPWFISFKSNPWSFGLLIFLVCIEILFLFYLLFNRTLVSRLPSVETLEASAYKTISLSFFLMTVVLITGALWAHYAWGRYWAWDPKETGALAIWINYAIYLHTRRTNGLSGPFSSVVGIIGFFVIIVGFLGVNLGLFADGLHTYGNS